MSSIVALSYPGYRYSSWRNKLPARIGGAQAHFLPYKINACAQNVMASSNKRRKKT